MRTAVWGILFVAFLTLAASMAQEEKMPSKPEPAEPNAPKEAWLPEVKGFPRMRIEQRTLKPLFSAHEKWEDMCINWFKIIRKTDGWHMWYEAYDHTYRDDNDSFQCYARSKDGVQWERPNLGLVEHDGNKNNNIYLNGRKAGGVHGPTIFLDERAAAQERYKMVFARSLQGTGWAIFGATSADGLNWDMLAEPLLKQNCDSQNVCFRDGDFFRLYSRSWAHNRTVSYCESATFGNFKNPVVVLSADDKDPKGMDFYNPAAAKLADDLYVMFPSGFYSLEKDQTVRPHMAVSRDGKNFQRVGRDVVLPLGGSGSFDSKSIYVSPGAIPGDSPGTYWFYYQGFNVGHNGPQKMAGGTGRFLLVVEK